MTICALSTGIGASGVAIIRISGSETSFLVKALTNKALPKPREATLLELNNIANSRPIDQGIVIWFPGPKSYTGEDMAELHVHGSKAVVRELQNTILNTKRCRLGCFDPSYESFNLEHFAPMVKRIFSRKPYSVF